MINAPTAGILFGLSAAVLQSASYLFSRRFVLRHQNATLRLLVASHLWMALMAIVIYPFARSPDMPPVMTYIGPLLGSAGFYMAGQAGLFALMRHTQASRVAPLLGLKLLVLAVIVTGFMGQSLSLNQWGSVGLCVLAAFLIQTAGVRLTWQALAWLALACLGYSLSDLSITRLVHALHPIPKFHASVIGVCLSYAVCGLVALPLWRLAGISRNGIPWGPALPFAGFWFASMVVLYACFGLVGALYGNILQSTRGLISVLFGYALSRAGFHELEEPQSRRVLIQRTAAAALMFTAIWLFHA